jgi:hypothetical protein
MESLEQLKKDLIKSLRYTYYGSNNKSIKVRYGPEDEKFYLDWVEGSYESSLWLLIHKTMYHEGIYQKFLNDRCMAEVEQVIKDQPDCIYGANEDNFTPEEEANGYDYALIQETYLDGLYNAGIFFIGDQLKKNGYDVGQTFADWGIEGEEEDDEEGGMYPD